MRSGVWFTTNDKRNKAIQIPGEKQPNKIGEIAAIISAANAIPRFWPLKIKSDSQYLYVINGLKTNLCKWEDQGWVRTKNAPYFREAAYPVKRHTATTTF
jgi:ribonuclease HI